ncbi:MAG: NFACT family protein [Chloroflexia bacterium]|nr:NFACT family protein [Chloroflexia bacterium]
MFDVLTFAAVTQELREELLDGRIQRIGLVDPLTVAAEVYARGRRRALIASADPLRGRLLLADSLPSLDPALVTPFVLQARKYLRGGVLVGIEQAPLERVVTLSIAKRLPPHNAPRNRRGVTSPSSADGEDHRDDDEPNLDEALGIYEGGEIRRIDLIVEVMGRHSNLIMVDADGLVMESVKRVTPRMSRVRAVQPRRPYTLPPAQDKPDPRRLTSTGGDSLLTAADPGDDLARTLVRGLRAVSPQIAREAAFRATGDAATHVADISAEDRQELARHVRALFEPMLTGVWAPRVYERDGVVVGYAAIPMHHLAAVAEETALDRISAAIVRAGEASESVGGEAPRDHMQRRARLADAVRRERDKTRQRLHSIREQLAHAAEAERLRRWGELIFAHLWQIDPGQSELTVEGERIPLEPSIPAKVQALTLFEQYRKAQRAEGSLPEREAAAAARMGYFDQLLTHVEQSEGFAALEALREEFEAQVGPVDVAGDGSHKRPPKTPKRSPALTSAEGFPIHIGRSGRQNDAVTFDIAGPDDTWLHARGVPGSHVVIRWSPSGRDEDEQTIETAAALAAHYSNARSSGSVQVDVAKRRHVRKIKGAGPGMVTYRNERTVAVHPLDEETLRRAGRLT